MIGVEPITMFHLDPDKYEMHAKLVYPDSVLDEMARRAEENICEEVLARLGYVKVVRCRDCKRSIIDQTAHEYRESMWCRRFNRGVKPDCYCSRGERKEDE